MHDVFKAGVQSKHNDIKLRVRSKCSIIEARVQSKHNNSEVGWEASTSFLNLASGEPVMSSKPADGANRLLGFAVMMQGLAEMVQGMAPVDRDIYSV